MLSDAVSLCVEGTEPAHVVTQAPEVISEGVSWLLAQIAQAQVERDQNVLAIDEPAYDRPQLRSGPKSEDLVMKLEVFIAPELELHVLRGWTAQPVSAEPFAKALGILHQVCTHVLREVTLEPPEELVRRAFIRRSQDSLVAVPAQRRRTQARRLDETYQALRPTLREDVRRGLVLSGLAHALGIRLSDDEFRDYRAQFGVGTTPPPFVTAWMQRRWFVEALAERLIHVTTGGSAV